MILTASLHKFVLFNGKIKWKLHDMTYLLTKGPLLEGQSSVRLTSLHKLVWIGCFWYYKHYIFTFLQTWRSTVLIFLFKKYYLIDQVHNRLLIDSQPSEEAWPSVDVYARASIFSMKYSVNPSIEQVKYVGQLDSPIPTLNAAGKCQNPKKNELTLWQQ